MLGSPSSLATILAMPLLLRMAREGGVIECGGSGTGVGVKLCNKWVEFPFLQSSNLIFASEGEEDPD